MTARPRLASARLRGTTVSPEVPERRRPTRVHNSPHTLAHQQRSRERRGVQRLSWGAHAKILLAALTLSAAIGCPLWWLRKPLEAPPDVALAVALLAAGVAALIGRRVMVRMEQHDRLSSGPAELAPHASFPQRVPGKAPGHSSRRA